VNTSYFGLLKLAAPETLVIIAAFAVLVADRVALRDVEVRLRQLICGMISAAGCLVAIGCMLALPQHANVQQGMLVIDPLTQLIKIALLGLTIFTVLISIETSFTTHTGEYFALLLFATSGMMFLASSEDILMIFVSLELTSLSLYILTAFNKRNIKSAEAALKYFLFGGMSAAFTLFGLSLLYGISGSTNLTEIANALKTVKLDPVAIAALVMTIIGFGFKVAAVPFHLWAPDAYEGAPTPSAALIASGSKVASFFIFAKVLLLGFNGAEGAGGWHGYQRGWVPVVAIVALCSMVLGNFAAIAQTSVRRLLAYSAIAHAGYVLVGFLSHTGQNLSAIGYYTITYGATVVGAFGVVSVVEEQTGGDKLSDFAGLSRRAPVLSFCMLVFMLSLAGIPPLAGFFGKFYLFTSALGGSETDYGLLWLVIAAVALSAVSLYYYLKVLKQIYVLPMPVSAASWTAPVLTQVVLFILAAIVLVLGCFPNLLVGPLVEAIQIVGFK
jgi:NADH-quinone oxidoreductase subunit N